MTKSIVQRLAQIMCSFDPCPTLSSHQRASLTTETHQALMSDEIILLQSLLKIRTFILCYSYFTISACFYQHLGTVKEGFFLLVIPMSGNFFRVIRTHFRTILVVINSFLTGLKFY